MFQSVNILDRVVRFVDLFLDTDEKLHMWMMQTFINKKKKKKEKKKEIKNETKIETF